MFISPIVWLFVIYISIGIFIMAEAIVEAWSWEEYPKGIKIVGAILCIIIWPSLFFM